MLWSFIIPDIGCYVKSVIQSEPEDYKRPRFQTWKIQSHFTHFTCSANPTSDYHKESTLFSNILGRTRLAIRKSKPSTSRKVVNPSSTRKPCILLRGIKTLDQHTLIRALASSPYRENQVLCRHKGQTLDSDKPHLEFPASRPSLRST